MTSLADCSVLVVGATGGLGAPISRQLAAEGAKLTRTGFVVGSPAGGLPAALPHDVNVADAARQSPIAWRGAARQSVTLRLDLGGRTVVHRPADRDLSADSGLFQAVTTADDDRLTFRRELTLVAARAPERWPAVRGLLLAETDAAAEAEAAVTAAGKSGARRAMKRGLPRPGGAATCRATVDR